MTLSCSCLHHERWRLSRLRLAAKVAVSQAAIGPPVKVRPLEVVVVMVGLVVVVVLVVGGVVG